MIKLFKNKNWEVFGGTREEAIAHITKYLEAMDYLDCDTCWAEYVELYDSELSDITVFEAHYSGWENGEKLYPVSIEYESKEALKKRFSDKWGWYLTILDPTRDYIIV